MELWGITQEDWEYEPVFFFGEWSETKMRYMITMLGCVSFMNWYYNEDSFFPDFITFLRHHIAHNDNQRVT